MAVITDVNANFCVAGLKNGVAQIAGFEKEFFVKTRCVWNVIFTVFAQNAAVRVNHDRRVVKYARLLPFINRNDDNHAVFFSQFLHQIRSGVWNRLSRRVPFWVLTRTEIGRIKNLLQAKDLHALFARFFDVRNVFIQHRLHDFFN